MQTHHMTEQWARKYCSNRAEEWVKRSRINTNLCKRLRSNSIRWNQLNPPRIPQDSPGFPEIPQDSPRFLDSHEYFPLQETTHGIPPQGIWGNPEESRGIQRNRRNQRNRLTASRFLWPHSYCPLFSLAQDHPYNYLGLVRLRIRLARWQNTWVVTWAKLSKKFYQIIGQI